MKKFVFCFVLIFTISTTVFATQDITLNIANNLYNATTEPTVGSVGGEWLIIGLKGSGINIPYSYYETYYNNLLNFLKANDGVLSKRKNTEYARVIIALNSIGKNPENVGGYNLVLPLLDYETTVKQGINGAAWALIALDSGNYGDKEIRNKYIDKILSSQLSDGGWSISSRDKDCGDPDVTGMVLQALSDYKHIPDVMVAINKALVFVSSTQRLNGGFTSYGVNNAESSCQILLGLLKLDIDFNHKFFVKNGMSVLDNLMIYYQDGWFKHMYRGEINQMATEQALICLNELNNKKQKQNYFGVRLIMPYERLPL